MTAAPGGSSTVEQGRSEYGVALFLGAVGLLVIVHFFPRLVAGTDKTRFDLKLAVGAECDLGIAGQRGVAKRRHAHGGLGRLWHQSASRTRHLPA